MTSEPRPHDDQTPQAQPSGRRRWVVIVSSAAAGLALVALLVVGLANRDVGTTIQDALAAGERPAVPALNLPVLSAADGIGPVDEPFDLEETRGRVVVLNFWASWCKPCEAEAPILEGIARGYRERSDEVVVVGVGVEDLRDSAERFIERFDVSYANVRDPGDETKLRFQVGNLPETFVIDPDGRIALKHIGQITSPAQLTTAVEQILAEEAR